jgi:peptide deformylase
MDLTLRYYGDPILRRRASDVTEFTPELRALAEAMVETMRREEGVGLAAPQVGRDARLLIALRMEDPDDDEAEPLVLVNPEVVDRSRETWEYEEGCLSIPGIRGDVTRPLRVSVRYRDVQGRPHTLEADGMFARVLQHEIDHLDGRLFIDYLSPAEKTLLKPRLKKLADRLRLDA